MTKTIELTTRTTRFFFIINGGIFLALGLPKVVNTDLWTNWGGIAGIILFMTGIFFLGCAMVLSYPKSKLTPKIQFTDNEIIVREDFLKAIKKIDWQRVKKITSKPFEICFYLNDQTTTVVFLPTNKEIAVAVMGTVQEIADQRKIRVIVN